MAGTTPLKKRAMQSVARGIGRTSLERAAALADEHAEPLVGGLRRLGEQGGRTGPRIRAFLELLESLREEIRDCTTAEALALSFIMSIPASLAAIATHHERTALEVNAVTSCPLTHPARQLARLDGPDLDADSMTLNGLHPRQACGRCIEPRMDTYQQALVIGDIFDQFARGFAARIANPRRRETQFE